LRGFGTRLPIKVTFQDSVAADARSARRRAQCRVRQDCKEAKMAIGKVKWFDARKGFGFIQPEAGGKDVFVHISAVERAGMDGLAEGQRISYEIAEQRGKAAATNLKLA
jgi:CspA family cold shock protein